MQRNSVICLVGKTGPKIFSLTPAERLQRQFARGNILAGDGAVIVIRADAVLDQPLIAVLIETPRLLLLGEGNIPLAVHVMGHDVSAATALLSGEKPTTALDLDARTPGELGVKFWKSLRKRETPYAFAVTPANAAAVEWRVYMGTYKGATDIVTKYLWPLPAFHATRWLAARGVTPNAVTTLGAILMVLAFFLFWRGEFAWGLAAAWLMTFLDTVDGKLARVTLTSSKWGDIFDHGIDLVHPPFWYVAWGLALSWSATTFWWVIIAILGGYILQRLMEGIAIKWLGLEIHIWRKADTLFRQVTARRNPNLVLLTLGVLIGRPDWGLLAVAIWTLACLVLHALQLLQALAARRRGPLTSWMMQG